MDRVARKDVADTAFDVVLRGYDKRQVDERLRVLGAELAAAHKALAAAAQRVAVLEDALNQPRPGPGGDLAGEANFGARVERILTLAEDEAREVRSQAEAAAVALLDQARTQVADQRKRAEQEIAAWRAEAHREGADQDSALRRRSHELDTLRQEVEQERENLLAQAREEAERIRTTTVAQAEEMGRVAREEADLLVTQARAEADRLISAASDSAAQRERTSAHELHQLSRLQEEINTDLFRVKDVLDSLFGPGGAVAGPILGRRRKEGAQPRQPARSV